MRNKERGRNCGWRKRRCEKESVRNREEKKKKTRRQELLGESEAVLTLGSFLPDLSLM